MHTALGRGGYKECDIRDLLLLSSLYRQSFRIHRVNYLRKTWFRPHMVGNMRYPISLTMLCWGFRLVVQCPSLNNTTAQTFQHQEDALVEFGGKAKLSPKTTRSVRIPASVANCPGKISAAIFEDGTVYGDQDSLEYLYDQRKGTYLGVSFAKNLVDQLPPGADLSGAADALDAQRAKVTSNRTVSVSTWSGQIATLSYLASVLRGGNETHVPSDDTPRRQPSINDLATTSHIPRSQAQVSIMRKKLYEWIAALEGNIEMPSAITSSTTF